MFFGLREYETLMGWFGTIQSRHWELGAYQTCAYFSYYSVLVWTPIGIFKMAQYKWDKQNLVPSDIQSISFPLDLEKYNNLIWL